MRMTNTMITNNVMYHLNNNLYNMNTIYNKQASGTTIQSPSDDPIGAANSMKYSAYLQDIEQYKSNVDDAYAWMEITESALNNMNDCVSRSYELILQASTETMTDDDLKMIQSEVEQIMKEIVEISNSDYAGTYIFAGYESSEEPHSIETTVVGDKLTYNDTYMDLGGPVSTTILDSDYIDFYTANESKIINSTNMNQTMTYNINANSSVDVNIQGYELFGEESEALYETLIKFDLFLSGESQYKEIDTTTTPFTCITKDIDTDELINDIQAAQDKILSLNAEIGSKMSYVDMTKNRLTDDEITYTTLLSETQDADLAEVSVELSQAEYVYEASLSSASKLILPSLVDFIR